MSLWLWCGHSSVSACPWASSIVGNISATVPLPCPIPRVGASEKCRESQYAMRSPPCKELHTPRISIRGARGFSLLPRACSTSQPGVKTSSLFLYWHGDPDGCT